jgi:hypothetical protein
METVSSMEKETREKEGGERTMTGYNTWERDVFRSYLARVQAKHEREMREKERNERDDDGDHLRGYEEGTH